ncbi:hypothetical protein DK37_24130 [Halomonas sp. SUBG004]|nr:hypothetical protein DK37_24130 [Halomonas sp. SUBG004]
MIIAARGEQDEATRRQMYHDIQVLYQQEGSTVAPLYMDSISANRANVRGVCRRAGRGSDSLGRKDVDRQLNRG